MSAWKRWAALPICASIATIFAACASPPAPVLLTLPAVSDAAASTTAPMNGTRMLALRRLEIPEYLAARRVRYRADDSTLAEWPNTYWAERLEIGVLREFSAALHDRLPGWRLCEVRCAIQSPTATLQVQIKRMDYMRDQRRLLGTAHFALWSSERSPRLIHSELHNYDIRADGDAAQSQARAISELLRRVAQDVSLSLAAAL